MAKNWSSGGELFALFVLACIFGPLGFLIAFASGKRCPLCQRKVHPKTVVCPECASTIPEKNVITEEERAKKEKWLTYSAGVSLLLLSILIYRC